jgi:ubiquinone/menaquinone biosynthesis C-methylase UbiE
MMFHPQGPTFWELAVQALSSTERGYDLLAPKFDYTPFRTPDVVLDKVGEHLRALGPFASGLDVCCGTGAAMRMLRPLCRERVVGLDRSAGMLQTARQRTADAPGSAVLEFVRADALAMPFDGAFDLAVSFGPPCGRRNTGPCAPSMGPCACATGSSHRHSSCTI